MLADSLAFYRGQIEAQIRRPADREPLGHRLDAFVITRLLGRLGSSAQLRWLEWIIAVVTLVVLPLVLLSAFQIRFLAYHSETATWWHRIWVLADLCLLLLAMPRILGTTVGDVSGGSPVRRFLAQLGLDRAVGRFAVPIAVHVLFTLFVVTVPDERITQILPFPQFDGVMPRNLVPTDPDFANDERLDKVQWTQDLRGRDLRNAKLSGADLRKARLEGAQLQGAFLDKAQLQGASLDGALLVGAVLNEVQLNSAFLDGAQLQGALLDRARLQGASLVAAQLQGASLEWAELQGASLELAQLHGASLGGAQLQGASLVAAQLQGAALGLTQLQGASLDGAQLQGAMLVEANLWRTQFDEGTSFDLAIWKLKSLGDLAPRFTPYPKNEAKRLVETWMKLIPEGKFRLDARDRLAILVGGLSPEKYKYIEDNLMGLIDDVPSDIPSRLADFLAELACEAQENAYLAKRIALRVFSDLAADKVQFAKRLLDPACEGARELDADSRNRLRRLASGMP